MPVSYEMSKDMYDSIRYPIYWDAKQKKMMRSRKPLSDKDILDYVNSTFGLIRKVNEIVLV